MCCSSNGLRVKSSRRDWNHDISAGVALMIGLFVSVQPRSPAVRRDAFTAASDYANAQGKVRPLTLKPRDKLKETKFAIAKQGFCVCKNIERRVCDSSRKSNSYVRYSYVVEYVIFFQSHRVKILKISMLKHLVYIYTGVELY